MNQLIDLYIYSWESDRLKILLFKRADGKIYQNQWRMVGGKKEGDETSWQAALREMKEETGLEPAEFWVLPSINHFYEHKKDKIHLIPAFAAKIPFNSIIQLNSEHSEYKWVYPEEASHYLQWPEQNRLISLLSTIVLHDNILPEWRIEI